MMRWRGNSRARRKGVGSSDILEIVSTFGWIRLIGLFHLLAGLYILATPLHTPEDWWENPRPGEIPMDLVGGSIFTAVGATIVFGRRRVAINKRKGTVDIRWSVLSVGYSKRELLVFFNTIVIDREIASPSYRYPVRLAQRFRTLTLRKPWDYGSARSLARRVSRFLEWDVLDRSGGKELLRSSESIGQPLKARLGKHPAHLPPKPADCRIEAELRGTRLEVKVPAGGIRVVRWALLGFIGFGGIGAFLTWLRGGLFDAISSIPDIAYVPIALFLGLIGGFGLFRATHWHILLADSTQIQVQRCWLGCRAGSMQIPVDEMEDVDVVAPRESVWLMGMNPKLVLSLTTDRDTIEVGGGRSEEELGWLRDLIKWAIAGRDGLSGPSPRL